MIVLKLTDGLGNQMFQYAFARALQQRRNDKIYLDITKLGYGHIRSYSLDQFVLNEQDRKSTRLNSSHRSLSRMPSSA